MHDDRKWSELTFAERAVLRDQRAADNEIAEARAAADKRESDAIHAEHERPRHRGDCAGQERPCPWVSCRHHLALEINPQTGSIKLAFPDIEVWEMAETCALDLADRGGMTLEEVGAVLNVTRERVRQIEGRGRRLLAPHRRQLG